MSDCFLLPEALYIYSSRIRKLDSSTIGRLVGKKHDENGQLEMLTVMLCYADRKGCLF